MRAGLDGRRCRTAEDPLPVAHRLLVLSPPVSAAGVAAGAEEPGDGLQARTALVAVAGAASAPSVPPGRGSRIGRGQQPVALRNAVTVAAGRQRAGSGRRAGWRG